jgi:predicted transcriptional regulator
MLQNATANAWPPEKDARMLQLREEGMTNKEIAKELGTTEGAISGRRARLMFKKLDPASRRLPPIMPDNILQIAIEHAGLAKNHMYELDAISMYADQMHEDAKHRIAEEIKVIYDFSRDIIKRLIGDMRDIKPSACDVEIRTRKED